MCISERVIAKLISKIRIHARPKRTAVHETTVVYVRKSSYNVPGDFLLSLGGKDWGQLSQRHEHLCNMSLVSAIWARDGEVIEKREYILRKGGGRRPHTGLQSAGLTLSSREIAGREYFERYYTTMIVQRKINQ